MGGGGKKTDLFQKKKSKTYIQEFCSITQKKTNQWFDNAAE